MEILIVDDDKFSLEVLERTLALLGHTTVRAHDGNEALVILRKGNIRLVVTDWEMPGMSGLDFCRAVRNEDLSGYVYIIMLTGRTGSLPRHAGLRAGADDFLNKPLDSEELLVCLSTAERILALETRDVALFALAKLAESRDPEIGGHIERVQCYSRLLARNLSPAIKEAHKVDAEYIRLLYQTSPLHDLGKVGIPDAVLLKPGKLTPEEFEVMKTHAALGAQTLDAALQRFPNVRFLEMARDIAATHHEKLDGSGYPHHLAGEEIPFCGRIVALADVYDALTSRRIYKDAMSHQQARDFIVSQRGRHFDPDVVDTFLKVEDQFAAVAKSMRDAPAQQKIAPTSAAPFEAPATDIQCNILVVEDSPIVLKKLSDLLAATGQPIFAATNVQDAMKLFIDHSPGLIVSDWEMPGDSGVELCRQIRSRKTDRHLHFIMLTVHSDHESLMEAYEAGVDDFVGKPFNPEELIARVRAGLRIYKLHEELTRKTEAQKVMNSQLAVMNSRLDFLSITDELTGLFNRRHAMVRLEEQWALAERYNQSVTVSLIDIDHFKNVNDTFGHAAGDVVLRQVAVILRQMTRGTDVICRVGGEEFLILFASQTVDQAAICAERFRVVVASHAFHVGSAEIAVTLSIGIAGRTPAMTSFPDILRAADQMLYRAKHAGRNRVHLIDPIKEDNKVNESVNPLPGPVPVSQRTDPLFDTDRLLNRCCGDAEFAAAVTEQFRTQAPSEISRLDEALAARNADVFRGVAHSLKSMSAYVSADVAADLSSQLEELARADRLADVTPLLQQLHTEIDSIVALITETRKARETTIV